MKNLAVVAFMLNTAAGARAQSGEFSGIFPTDTSDVQVLSPQTAVPKAGRYGGFLERDSADITAEILGNNQGTTESTERTVTAYGAKGLFDIGAGAAVGLTFSQRFLTDEVNDGPGTPMEEQRDSRYIGLSLLVDLAEKLRAGLVLRTLHVERMVIGNFNLNQNAATRYRSTMFGYGLGVSYSFDKATIALQTLPALRGKTDVLGEERIITEPGSVELGAHINFDDNGVVGFSYIRHVHKRDELAEGTTANNANNSVISLTGLAFDRFLFADKTYGLGYDRQINPKALGRLGLFREDGEFIFNTTGTPGQSETATKLTTYRFRAAVLYLAQKLVFQGGIGFAQGDANIPNRAKYESFGREIFVLVSTTP